MKELQQLDPVIVVRRIFAPANLQSTAAYALVIKRKEICEEINYASSIFWPTCWYYEKNFIVVEFDGIIARKLNQTSAFGAWVSQRNTSSYQGSSGPFVSL